MSRYLGWLPAVVPASRDRCFISATVTAFRRAKLNLTILNLVRDELGDPPGYSRKGRIGHEFTFVRWDQIF